MYIRVIIVEEAHINAFISVLSYFVYVYAQSVLVSEIESVKCGTSAVCDSKCKCVTDALVLVRTFQFL